MPTHAELAARLLNDAAVFFENLGDQNPALKPQMQSNATVFRQMAELIVAQPLGEGQGRKFAEMAGQLLKDAGSFFAALAEENEAVREQMNQNAEIFQQMGDMVAKNPLGTMN